MLASSVHITVNILIVVCNLCYCIKVSCAFFSLVGFHGRSISPDPSLLHVSEPSGPSSKGCTAEPFTDQPDAGRSEQGGLFNRSGLCNVIFVFFCSLSNYFFACRSRHHGCVSVTCRWWKNWSTISRLHCNSRSIGTVGPLARGDGGHYSSAIYWWARFFQSSHAVPFEVVLL